MPVKKHKALDRRDQSSKRLISHTYTKGSKGRIEQPEAYSEENTIQTWSGKHGERESRRDTSSDESCNEMREHRWKDKQTKSSNRGAVLELLKSDHQKPYLDGKPTTRKTTSKTTKL
ncbi:hypothetical protein F2Q69_00014648 [Brassica cretica]|uniref:Uncharacterized protein n=1 Tax=Brassica cretica TaxID=69181 RepID=A0A8S9R2E7_BRACR|nr:hypothetical protein F2Q69_00014648 [Brassica cretica]